MVDFKIHGRILAPPFKLSIYIGLSIVLTCCVCLSSNAAVIAGKSVSLSGDVLIRNEDSIPSLFRRLHAGEGIFAGDVINTSSRGSVKLLMTDKTILDLGPTTLFKVNEYLLKNGSDRNVSMTMGYGKIRASVNTPVGRAGRFRIRTRAAVMGVRGTEFIVAADLGEITGIAGPHQDQKKDQVKTQVTVIHGKVDVTRPNEKNAKTTSVDAGKQLTTSATLVNGDKVQREPAAEQKTQLVELSHSELKKEVELAKVEDKTFKQAVVIDRTSDPSAGASTLSAVAFSISDPSLKGNYGPGFGGIGTPGTNLTPVAPNNRIVGLPVNLQVVFKK